MGKDVICRIVVFIILIINELFTALGKNPIPVSEDEVYAMVSTILSIGYSIYMAFKFNPVTANQKKANVYLNELNAYDKEVK